jgi:hypothetical protein
MPTAATMPRICMSVRDLREVEAFEEVEEDTCSFF